MKIKYLLSFSAVVRASLIYQADTNEKITVWKLLLYARHWNQNKWRKWFFWHDNQPLPTPLTSFTRVPRAIGALWRWGWRVKTFWKTVSLIRKINKRYRRVLHGCDQGLGERTRQLQRNGLHFFQQKTAVLLGRLNFLVKYARRLTKYDVIAKD